MKNKDMEKQRIDNIASKSLYASGASSISIDYSFEILTRYIKDEIIW